MIEWPLTLVEDLARRRAILFLGSGVSKNATSRIDVGRHPPTWEEFLQKALGKCDAPTQHLKRLLAQGDYLTACEIIKHRLDDKWNEFVHAQFVAPQFQAADIHRDIFKLDSRIVLTQNVDRIYDTFAASESEGTVYVKDYSKADVAIVVRGNRRCILKAHGSVDTPDEMIFTRQEYAQARHDYGSFYVLLDALALTHTMLFIGCGVADPDVQLMLERHASMYPGSRPHVMVAPKSEFHAEVAQSLKRTMNLQIMRYKTQDDHAELRESLSELVTLVDAQREELARTRDW